VKLSLKKKKSNWRFGALNLNVAVKFEKGAGNQRQLEREREKKTIKPTIGPLNLNLAVKREKGARNQARGLSVWGRTNTANNHQGKI